jgi:hypothetical protein
MQNEQRETLTAAEAVNGDNTNRKTQLEELYKSDAKRFIFEGIWKVVRAATDLMDDRTVQDIADNVWLWAVENPNELFTPGTAKISTRLYEKAYWQARAWKTAALRAQQKFISLDALEETAKKHSVTSLSDALNKCADTDFPLGREASVSDTDISANQGEMVSGKDFTQVAIERLLKRRKTRFLCPTGHGVKPIHSLIGDQVVLDCGCSRTRALLPPVETRVSIEQLSSFLETIRKPAQQVFPITAPHHEWELELAAV